MFRAHSAISFIANSNLSQRTRTVFLRVPSGPLWFVQASFTSFRTACHSVYPLAVTISVVLITQNEEANLPMTLESVMPLVREGRGEIIVVDSGSTDRTLEIARSYGAKIFPGPWKGFAAQKNSAMDKATCDWVKHGGFYPDPKLRLVRRGAGKFEEYGAHPTIKVNGPTGQLKQALIHNAYPTLRGYIDHMNSYSSSGAQIAIENGHRGFSFVNVVLRPLLTFIYNYCFRLGFLDGREGLLLHLYHSVYVSWKYAKAWELERKA